MNGWRNPAVAVVDAPVLFGVEGELVLVRVSVDPRHLEELLEALAGLEFPVNPELMHRVCAVTVEFPAYATHVNEVKTALEVYGFDPKSLAVFGMLHSPVSQD